ncbi:MAG: hypothetical protein HY884_07610 [Deltaproteobacteria bacterium]|nr:hypothetical protein [Deltaproteobacteria bacterium]
MSDGYYIRSFLATVAGLAAFIAVVAALAFYSQVIAWGILSAAVFFLFWFYKTPVRRVSRSSAISSSTEARVKEEGNPLRGGRYPK